MNYSNDIVREVARRRTFGIISHPDAGKTTLTEKLLMFSGAIQLAGTVKARKSGRHATSDWMEIEKQRGISVASSVMQMLYRDHVINLLDTDEFYDLTAEPLELQNRVNYPASTPERERLLDELLAWMNRTRDPLRGPHWARRPWGSRPGSTWGGPTRPRPFDEAYYPKTLLYDTGKVIDRLEYSKH